MRQVRSTAVEQMQLAERINAHAYDHEFAERNDLVDNEAKLLSWLTSQVDDARSTFEPYLGFSDVQRNLRRLPNER